MDITIELMKPITIGIGMGLVVHYIAYSLRTWFDVIRTSDIAD